MIDVKIDGPLLRHLREAGLTDKLTAAHCIRVLTGDARSQRAIAQHCSGDAAFEDDVVVAPIRIAHGIHWCGGQLRMVDAHAQIPSGIQEALIGRPLLDLIDMPGITDDVRIIGVRHDDTQRFDLYWRREDNPRVTIVETDARPEIIGTDRISRMKAPWTRFVEDERLIASEDGKPDRRMNIIRDIGLNIALQFGMMAVFMFNAMKGRGLAEGIVAAVFCGLAWVALMLIASNTRRDKRNVKGGAHLRFSREMRDRQVEEGMRD